MSKKKEYKSGFDYKQLSPEAIVDLCLSLQNFLDWNHNIIGRELQNRLISEIIVLQNIVEKDLE